MTDAATDTKTPEGDGRRARWRRHNEERRRRIVAAAIDVVEESEPGAELQVQEIAARAGVGRTVLYRHFEDRAELHRAVQQEILAGLWAELLPAVSLEGTVPEIVERIVGTYIRWAVAHPSLHRLADHDLDDPDDTDEHGQHRSGPLQEGLERLAGQIGMVITAGTVALGGSPTEEEQAALDPLVFALVGAVFGAVRRWLVTRPDVLDAEALIEYTSRSVWYVIDGHARAMGVEIDPSMPVLELLEPSGQG